MTSRTTPVAPTSRAIAALATSATPWWRSGRMLRAGRFAAVGVSGIGVNQVALWAAVTAFGMHYALGAILATQVSTAWNFGFTERWVFRARSRGAAARFLSFAAVNNIALLGRVPLLALLTTGLGLHYLFSNLVTLAVLFATRFAVSDRYIWGRAAGDRGEAA